MGLDKDFMDKLRKRTEKYKKDEKVTNYRISEDIKFNHATLKRFIKLRKGLEYDNMVKLDHHLEWKGY